MAEFCKCGSLVIGGRCTNKSCSEKGPEKPAPARTAKKAAASEKNPAKTTKTRRASKCITYNLYETGSEEGGSV